MDTTKEFIKERVISQALCESVGEYSLPDYNTDIKKLLLTNARAVPSGTYQNGDMLEVVGNVYYDMVYLDGENGITHLDFTTDYSMVFKVSAEDYVSSDVYARVANFTIRLSGPRKIVAKANVSCDAHITERCTTEVKGDSFDGTPEYSEKTVLIKGARFLHSDEREYAETLFHLEGAVADETDILMTGLEIEDLTVSGASSGINVKGTVVASVLLALGESEPQLMKKSIPYSEILDTEYTPDNVQPEVSVVFTSCRATAAADEDGVDVVLSYIAECSVRICENTPVSLIDDCYLKERGCDNEYSDFGYSELQGAYRLEDGFSTEISRESAGCQDVRNLVCSICKVRNESAEVEGNEVTVSCEIRFSAIACQINGEGEPEYSSVKIDIPYSKKFALDKSFPPKTRCDFRIEATGADITVDSEKVYPECKIMIYLSMSEDKKTRTLVASSLTDEYFEISRSRVTVYFPEPGDTLFSVAKKYHTGTLTVASDNSLAEGCLAGATSPSSLMGVKKLIIK